MKTCSLLLAVALGGVCLGAETGTRTATGVKEPTYEGRALSDWVAQSKSKDWFVRKGAARALWNLGSAAVPALTELLNDDKREVRWAAMEALGNLGSKAKMAIPALVESCRNDDYYLVTIYSRFAEEDRPASPSRHHRIARRQTAGD